MLTGVEQQELSPVERLDSMHSAKLYALDSDVDARPITKRRQINNSMLFNICMYVYKLRLLPLTSVNQAPSCICTAISTNNHQAPLCTTACTGLIEYRVAR